MGRVVRSPKDYGVRILLDSRYQGSQARKLGKFSVFDYFPPEEKKEFIDIAPREVGGLVEEFFAHVTSSNLEDKEPESQAPDRLDFESLAEKL
jgi:DNA excision repair protein ERCC-2